MQKLQPFDLVLFGGTGDLAMRKLLPAFYRRVSAGQIESSSRIIAVARSTLDREGYLADVERKCRPHLSEGEFTQEHWQAFTALVDYLPVNATVAEDFDRLAEKLKSLPGSEERVRVMFLSMAPSLFTSTCENLGRAKLVTPQSRVVLEKPLGQDRASAEAINQLVGSIFLEKQIYRIDHYLGKETVQNLIALRFGNTLFEPLWRRGSISHVQITVGEHVGAEGRGEFYNQTGAMRDMVQNHLLQLLCILAMEPPASSDADAVRDEKLKVLHALRPMTEPDVQLKTVRGQYRAGAVDGKPVPGYLQEPGVPAGSTTETFVALKAEIDTWRWAGVPFYLRTGKRMQDKLAEIVVAFTDVPLHIFEPAHGTNVPNRMVFRLQPDESITLTIMTKLPGEVMRLRPVNLSLDLAGTFKERPLDAYERLLTDVIKGNLTLFMRRDELDAAWRWIDPIREGWANQAEAPKGYTAGSWGPAASSALIGRDGFEWHGET